ncbi:MAG TPA: hydroxymethylbilane synthase [Solirubrobacteraceae bacterium]|nr:hydroxymethylbilane synthase [Solirubrobacteraceae bacterium]
MRIGTRGSALALAQAMAVATPLREAGATVELVTVLTTGDRGERPADKSRWVAELERAMLDGRIDAAVHSAKDVPAQLAAGLELVAITAREDPRDALCGARSIAALPAGARVGTSSLRRGAQLHAARADLVIVELRGNVDTRLAKLAGGEVDALVLALAGLRRLGRESAAGGVLDELVPAAGQGALAIEARAGSSHARSLAALADAGATACVTAERSLTRALGASCQTAVGAHAHRLAGEGGLLELTGWVGLPDGSRWIEDRLSGAEPEALGRAVAERMLAVGAGELLAAVAVASETQA